jgi:hypothetical protein
MKSTLRDRLKSHRYDEFQTPDYALGPLLKYLQPEWVIWEPACGDGCLVTRFRREGFTCVYSDILCGEQFDFLRYEIFRFDCIVTNPPLLPERRVPLALLRVGEAVCAVIAPVGIGGSKTTGVV